jgi:hypothetical protein
MAELLVTHADNWIGARLAAVLRRDEDHTVHTLKRDELHRLRHAQQFTHIFHLGHEGTDHVVAYCCRKLAMLTYASDWANDDEPYATDVTDAAGEPLWIHPTHTDLSDLSALFTRKVLPWDYAERRDDFLAWFNTTWRNAEIALHNGDAAPRFRTWSDQAPVTLFGAWFNATDPAGARKVFLKLAQGDSPPRAIPATSS